MICPAGSTSTLIVALVIALVLTGIFSVMFFIKLKKGETEEEKSKRKRSLAEIKEDLRLKLIK